MLPWIIGGAVAIGTAIAAAASDSSSSSSSSTTSDENERREEALKEEREKKEQRSWSSFRKTAENERKKLADITDKYNIKSVTLHNINSARIKISGFRGVYEITGLNLLNKKNDIPWISFKSEKFQNSVKEDKLQLLNLFTSLIAENISSIVWDTASSINTREIDTDLKYFLLDNIGDNAVNDLEKFLKAANETQPRIAATGILKAGKSTIMNCLTGDFTNERFQTGIIRETVKEKIFEKDGYLFVDTPGIDANESDTNEAVESLKVSDIVLFAHNMNGGSLDEPERNFLTAVRKNWEKPSEFIEKLIVVLTHLDKKENDQALIEKDIREQFKNIFGLQPVIISVSSSRYLKGVNENKNLLVQKSNYSKLNRYLGEKTLDIVKIKKERYLKKAQKEAESILMKMRELQKKMTLDIEKEENEYSELHEEFASLVEKANTNIKNAYSNYLKSTGN